ncbi:MAG: sigma-70 family RNA polymerase sigma factor [Planctomycetota bacterium]
MADDDQEWRKWVEGLVEGDEQVAGEFWDQYGARLQGLAARHLTTRLYRREGPDDVVQSVCRTFFRRARVGQFELSDSESLWRLLCAITVTKVRLKARFHGRQKRRFHREKQLDESGPGMADFGAPEPTPAEAVEFADQLEQLMADLDEEERRLVELKLQQATSLEIAEQLGCSERTVRRILKRVESRWRRVLEQS